LKSLAVLIALTAVAVAAPPAPPKPGRVVGKVTVNESDGKPAAGADVVVWVVGFDEEAEKKGQVAATIEQKNHKFIPDLVAITKDEKVAFPNRDPITHNVFSKSPPREFDLGEFKGGDNKDINFGKLGVVDIYCNIHSDMAATILVLPNKRHVHTKPDGTYVLDGVPPGEWQVFAYARRATKPAVSKVKVDAGVDATADFTVTRGVEPPHLNKFGEKYKKTYP
jgi:plastocyanin